MLLAIISSVFCMAMGAFMYTPRMRSYKTYRPTAFLFLFEGIWTLLDYIFRQIFPDNVFMQAIHCIGLTVLVIYFFICAFILGRKNEKSSPMKKSLKKK